MKYFIFCMKNTRENTITSHRLISIRNILNQISSLCFTTPFLTLHLLLISFHQTYLSSISSLPPWHVFPSLIITNTNLSFSPPTYLCVTITSFRKNLSFIPVKSLISSLPYLLYRIKQYQRPPNIHTTTPLPLSYILYQLLIIPKILSLLPSTNNSLISPSIFIHIYYVPTLLTILSFIIFK